MADEEQNQKLAKVFEVPKLEGASRHQYEAAKNAQIIQVLTDMLKCDRDSLVARVFDLYDRVDKGRQT